MCVDCVVFVIGGMGGLGVLIGCCLYDVGMMVVVLYRECNDYVVMWFMKEWEVGWVFYVFEVDVVDYDLC